MKKVNPDFNIKEFVNTIEIASDDIIRYNINKMVIDDISEEALRRIKSVISSIRAASSHCNEDKQSAYMPVLERILDYINEAARNPIAIENYADRIQHCVENYIILEKPYDEAYESDRDKELLSFIKAKSAATKMSEIAKEMHVLVERKINCGFGSDSPEYKMIVTRYNDLQNSFNIYSSQLDDLQNVIEQNAYIRQAVERSISLSEVNSLGTMSLEDYSVLAYSNREKAIQSKGLLNAFARIANDVAAPVVSMKQSEADFRKAEEDTLLERLYKDNAEQYGESIINMPKSEYNNALIDLIRKLNSIEDGISKLKGQEKQFAEQTQKQLNDLLTQTEDAAIFRDDVGGDIEKEVNYCLARTPADIAGANLKIRSCIELYCRFVKGVDLNDKLFFVPNESVENKMNVAGITHNRKMIADIYSSTNRFIHNDYTVLDMSEEDVRKEIETVKTNVANIKKWELDSFDVYKGFQLFYTNQDKQLKEMIDSGKLNRSFYEEEKNKKIYYYFKRMTNIKSFLEKHNVTVPQIEFDSKEAVEKYLNVVESGKSSVVSVQREPQKSGNKVDNTPRVASGNKSKRQEGTVTSLNVKKRCGWINGELFFFVPDYADALAYAVGTKLSYTIGQDKQGRNRAESIAIISSSEMTT